MSRRASGADEEAAAQTDLARSQGLMSLYSAAAQTFAAATGALGAAMCTSGNAARYQVAVAALGGRRGSGAFVRAGRN